MTTSDPAMPLVAPLFDGPVDIVGDVHGEVDALRRLVAKLGYDAQGRHPEGRRLVFVGDLGDRGPDSPAVMRWVSARVAEGRAQCLLGNHELNLLRDVPKPNNEWWTKPEEDTRLPAVPVTRDDRARFTRFMQGLPVVLEREDLRVVHACWDDASVDAMRAVPAGGVLACHHRHVEAFERRWGTPEREAALAAERARFDLTDRDSAPAFLPITAEREAEKQIANPVTVLTSGLERPADEPFWASGQWRVVERVRWWSGYEHPATVVVGHYWRHYADALAGRVEKHGPDLFENTGPADWLGARANVYCVDFCAGARGELRERGEPEDACQLAALRVPEWQVVFDAASSRAIGLPGR